MIPYRDTPRAAPLSDQTMARLLRPARLTRLQRAGVVCLCLAALAIVMLLAKGAL